MEIKDYLKPTPKAKPLIYAYIAHDGIGNSVNDGYIKVGYTAKHIHDNDFDNVLERIKEQTHTPGLKPTILGVWDAYDVNGGQFTDKDVHKILERHGHQQLMATTDDNEWYKCDLSDIENAINELKLGKSYGISRTNTFGMRPEQEEAVMKTME